MLVHDLIHRNSKKRCGDMVYKLIESQADSSLLRQK